MITVRIEPEGHEMTFEKLNTALQLLNRLGVRPNSALVIRGDELLTPDRKLRHGERITVRMVGSRG
jgi:sulfur carrier protein